MELMMFVIDAFEKIEKIDFDNPVLATLQLNSLKSEFVKAVFKGVIDLESYQTLSEAIENAKALL